MQWVLKPDNRSWFIRLKRRMYTAIEAYALVVILLPPGSRITQGSRLQVAGAEPHSLPPPQDQEKEEGCMLTKKKEKEGCMKHVHDWRTRLMVMHLVLLGWWNLETTLTCLCWMRIMCLRFSPLRIKLKRLRRMATREKRRVVCLNSVAKHKNVSTHEKHDIVSSYFWMMILLKQGGLGTLANKLIFMLRMKMRL